MKGRAIVTGADGGMGRCITTALARAGYEVIMVCREYEQGKACRDAIVSETANEQITVKEVNLEEMKQVEAFADEMCREGKPLDLLMNNAGVLSTGFEQTTEGLEKTVAVNYMAPYLLTRKLLPLLHEGSRVVSMVSCTYAIGKITPRSSNEEKRVPFGGFLSTAIRNWRCGSSCGSCRSWWRRRGSW